MITAKCFDGDMYTPTWGGDLDDAMNQIDNACDGIFYHAFKSGESKTTTVPYTKDGKSCVWFTVERVSKGGPDSYLLDPNVTGGGDCYWGLREVMQDCGDYGGQATQKDGFQYT